MLRSIQLFWAGMTLFILHYPCNGQSVLSGKTIDFDGDPVPGALVQLYKPDSVSLIKYTKANARGTWQFQDLQTDFYLLKIASLGNESWQQRIFVPDRDSIHLKTILLPTINQIGIVQISADKLGIVARGDTTFYNIDAFIDSTEYNLGDILKKLPQISVDQNGSIRYKGQRVDVVLTNGKDIFGQLHKQMVEGIKADDVESVQVITNFQGEKEEFALTEHAEVALNVKLKEESANHINGDIGLNTNLEKFYEANSTLYKTGKSLSFSALLRANNTAQPTLSGIDFFALIDIDHLSKYQDPTEIEKYLPLFTPIIDERRNNDKFGFGRIIFEPTSSWTSKASILYTNFQRFAERASARIYTPGNSIFTGVKQRDQPSRMLQITTQNLYKKNRFQFDFQTSLLLNGQERNNKLSGQLDSNSIKSEHQLDGNTINFSPFLRSVYQIDSLYSFVLLTQVKYLADREMTNLLAATPLFDLSDTSISQNSKQINTSTYTSLTLKIKSGHHEIKLATGFQSAALQFELKTEADGTADLWQNKSYPNDRSPFLDARFGRKTGPFRYSLGIESKIITRHYDAYAAESSFVGWNSHSGVYFDFTKNHNLYINFNLVEAPPPMIHLVKAKRIIGENNFRLENLDSSQLVRQSTFNIDWTNRNPSGVWDYQCRLNFSWFSNNILYFSTVENSYFVTKSYFSPKSSRSSFEINGRYLIKPWQASVAVRSNLEVAKEVVPGVTAMLNTNFHRISNSIRIACSRINKLSLSAGFTINYSERTYNGVEAQSGFWNNTYTLGLQFKSGVWQFGTTLNYQRQASTNALNKLWLWDCAAAYTIPNTPIRLRFIGRNMLNLNGVQMIMPDFNATYFGFDSFQTIGGQLMGGINWVF